MTAKTRHAENAVCGRQYQRFTFIKTDTNEWQVRSEIYRQDPANPNGEKIRLDNDQYSLNVNPNAEGAEGTAAEMGQNIFTLNFDNLGQIRTVTDQAGDVMDAGALYVTLNINIPAFFKWHNTKISNVTCVRTKRSEKIAYSIAQ